MVSALARTTGGDLTLAEDSLQDAILAATHQWPRQGVPEKPVGWLLRTARHKAIDQIRRATTHERIHDAIRPGLDTTSPPVDHRLVLPDDHLRLVLTCCHPGLPMPARVALTLKTVCGLTTETLARLLLTDPRATAQRVVRAKRLVKERQLGWTEVSAADLPDRLDAVMQVVYVLFTEGYAASDGPELLRTELCEEAIRLATLVVDLLERTGSVVPGELQGLLSLMLLQHARRAARVDPRGRLVLLPDQDRARWHHREIARGMVALGQAARTLPAGRYTLQAAIASVHARSMRAEDTDWDEICALYALLEQLEPGPAVRLNHAVAVAMAQGPAAGLVALDRLSSDKGLQRGHLLASARADLLRRLGRTGEAASAYRDALSKVGNDAERAFLEGRLVEVEGC